MQTEKPDRLITVIDASGEPIPGSVVLSAYESVWSYQPHSPWQSGRYEVVVHATLEDLAGNRLDRLFDEKDVDIAKETKAEVVRLPVTIQ